MGDCASQVCGSNIFKALMQKYGDDFAKFISIQKAKLYIEDKFEALKTQLGSKIKENKTQIFTKLDQKQKQLDELVLKVRKNLDDIIPGGLASIQRIKGQPIEQTLGYKQFKIKFKQLREKASVKLTEQEQKIWQQANLRKVEAIQKLQKQQPRIPLYDDLSEKQQRVIFEKGEQVFSKQIKQKQDEILKENEGSLNSDNYLDKLKDVLPAGSVDGLMGRAMEKFEAIAKKLRGGGLSDLAGKFL